ncbi:hypothetical protein FQZ97_987440 [compost metagenome]
MVGIAVRAVDAHPGNSQAVAGLTRNRSGQQLVQGAPHRVVGIDRVAGQFAPVQPPGLLTTAPANNRHRQPVALDVDASRDQQHALGRRQFGIRQGPFRQFVGLRGIALVGVAFALGAVHVGDHRADVAAGRRVVGLELLLQQHGEA